MRKKMHRGTGRWIEGEVEGWIERWREVWGGWAGVERWESVQRVYGAYPTCRRQLLGFKFLCVTGGVQLCRKDRAFARSRHQRSKIFV